jgi:acyl-CoA reductase-like NAD-dependent aldehyde dehydrogenase
MDTQQAIGPVRYWPMLINGKEHDGAAGAFERVSPAHDVVVGRYAQATTEDVDSAVAAARAALDAGPWRWSAGAVKARVLRRVAAAIADERDSLARIEALESGKPISQAREEMAGAAEIWFYAATLAQHTQGDAHNGIGPDHLALVVREPVGVVGVITPWNFPLLIASQKIPFALAAGCSVVAKASEFTPGTTTRLIQMLGEAGLPDGVANIVHGRGDVGAHLSTHPGTDMTSFTGSTAVGKAVMRAAADTLKHVSLELGGKNPQVVLADADLEKAVESVSWAAWFNQGECCNAGSRLLVQTEIADEFVQRLIELTRDVRTGDPLADDTEVGAIISDQHLERIDGYVRTGGGRVVAGGNRLTTDIGRYYAPTVLDDVAPGSPVATEEIFGPVLSVLRFDDLADAVRLTNDNGYGLSSGVWTRDVDAAISYARAVRAGTVWINDWMAGFPEVPFGGVGQSGIGRELGRSALDEFTESKSIVLRAGAAIGVRGTRVNTTPGSA